MTDNEKRLTIIKKLVIGFSNICSEILGEEIDGDSYELILNASASFVSLHIANLKNKEMQESMFKQFINYVEKDIPRVNENMKFFNLLKKKEK